jgi:hypothetical protein
MIVAVTVIVIMVIVIVIAAVIALMIVIPFMVMFEAAAIAFPIAVIEALSIVARADPTCTFIGRPAPIAFMPAIVACNGIPIAANPNKVGPGLCGDDSDNAWFGWRKNTDPNRYLRTDGDTDQRSHKQ